MGENLMNQAHKATNDAYRERYARLYKKCDLCNAKADEQGKCPKCGEQIIKEPAK